MEGARESTARPNGAASRGRRQRPGGRAAAIIVALLVVLVVVLLGAVAARRYEAYLSGLWVGEPEFLRRARLRDFQLFLAPQEGACRQGYLLVADLNGDLLANRAIEVCERSAAQRWWTALASTLRARGDAYRARRVDIAYDGAGAEPMPGRLSMALSLTGGTLVLSDGGEVYASLVKDVPASAAALAAYGAP
jgi:hypothetical protein